MEGYFIITCMELCWTKIHEERRSANELNQSMNARWTRGRGNIPLVHCSSMKPYTLEAAAIRCHGNGI